MYEVLLCFYFFNKKSKSMVLEAARRHLWSEKNKECNLKGSQVRDVSWEDYDGS